MAIFGKKRMANNEVTFNAHTPRVHAVKPMLVAESILFYAKNGASNEWVNFGLEIQMPRERMHFNNWTVEMFSEKI